MPEPFQVPDQTTGRCRDIADELRELLDQEDPRSLDEIKRADRWQEGTVQEATRSDDGWFVSWTEERERGRDGAVRASTFGGSFGAWVPDKGIEVKPGDTIRFYGDGFGFEFHGIDVNGREVFWRTPWERIARRVEGLASSDRRKRERYAEHHAQLMADYRALPEPFQKRLDRFADQSQTFWMESGAYELFCCKEAVKIAEHLRQDVEAGADPGEAVAAFYDLSFDEQKRRAGVDDGHSGNTFGTACALARAYLSGEAV